MSKIGWHGSGHPRFTWNRENVSRSRPPAVLELNGHGMLLEAKEWTNGHTWGFHRDTVVYGQAEAPGDLFTYDGDIGLMADYWLFEVSPVPLYEMFILNPADAHCNTNEQGGGEGPDKEIRWNYQRVVDYERECMIRMNARGIKMMVMNSAGGSPGNFQIWVDIVVPFLREAFAAGNFYGRHAYEGNWDRVYQEAQYLEDVGLGYGGMVVTEMGFNGGYGKIHDPEVMKAIDQRLMTHPNVIANLWWEYGDTEFDANVDHVVPALLPYMAANPTPKWQPGLPPTPGPGKTRDEYLWDESVDEQLRVGLRFNKDAALQKLLNDTGRTGIAHNEITRFYEGTSYVIQGGEDLTGVVERGVGIYQPGSLELIVNPYDGVSDPLPGLKLAPPFRKPFVTTSKFGEPRVYNGQDYKHEGWDGDIMGEPADSKEPVLCMYPGTVIKSGLSSGAYGFRVVVRCEYQGVPFDLWYCHGDSAYVNVGDQVTIGTHLMELGATGGDWAEHLHLNLQLTEGGETGPEWVLQHVIDPEPYIDFTIVPEDRFFIPGYFFPDSGDFSRPFMLKNNWGQGDERMQVQKQGQYSFIVKNRNYERRTYVPGRGMVDLFDTSPDEEHYYQSIGTWLPEYMKKGDSFLRSETVSFFNQSNCAPSNPPYTASSLLTLVDQYPTMIIGNETLHDVIRVEWFINNRVDETYWYAHGLGLVRWLKYTDAESWFHEWAGGGNNDMLEIPCLG